MNKIALVIVSLFAVSAFAQIPSADDLNAKANSVDAQATQATTQAKKDTKEVTGKATTAIANVKQQALVNLNTAPAEDLAKLPGIGPVRAKAIVAGRPYTGVNDLKKVKGIKEGVIAKIKNLVTVQ